jgi:hypothetical protein
MLIKIENELNLIRLEKFTGTSIRFEVSNF